MAEAEAALRRADAAGDEYAAANLQALLEGPKPAPAVQQKASPASGAARVRAARSRRPVRMRSGRPVRTRSRRPVRRGVLPLAAAATAAIAAVGILLATGSGSSSHHEAHLALAHPAAATQSGQPMTRTASSEVRRHHASTSGRHPAIRAASAAGPVGDHAANAGHAAARGLMVKRVTHVHQAPVTPSPTTAEVSTTAAPETQTATATTPALTPMPVDAPVTETTRRPRRPLPRLRKRPPRLRRPLRACGDDPRACGDDPRALETTPAPTETTPAPAPTQTVASSGTGSQTGAAAGGFVVDPGRPRWNHRRRERGRLDARGTGDRPHA